MGNPPAACTPAVPNAKPRHREFQRCRISDFVPAALEKSNQIKSRSTMDEPTTPATPAANGSTTGGPHSSSAEVVAIETPGGAAVGLTAGADPLLRPVSPTVTAGLARCSLRHASRRLSRGSVGRQGTRQPRSLSSSPSPLPLSITASVSGTAQAVVAEGGSAAAVAPEKEFVNVSQGEPTAAADKQASAARVRQRQEKSVRSWLRAAYSSFSQPVANCDGEAIISGGFTGSGPTVAGRKNNLSGVSPDDGRFLCLRLRFILVGDAARAPLAMAVVRSLPAAVEVANRCFTANNETDLAILAATAKAASSSFCSSSSPSSQAAAEAFNFLPAVGNARLGFLFSVHPSQPLSHHQQGREAPSILLAPSVSAREALSSPKVRAPISTHLSVCLSIYLRCLIFQSEVCLFSYQTLANAHPIAPSLSLN